MDSEVMDVRLQSWIPVLKAQAESGLNKREFCEKNGITENAFYKWQRYVRRKLLHDGLDLETMIAPSGSNESPTFVELPIRGYSVGRANWLFADTVTGAEVNAAMYSIVETAKANNVNPYTYIKYLIEKMPEHLDSEGNVTDRECLRDMVPWSDAFHSYERECTENRNRMYSDMFPAPVIPKPPGKTAGASKDHAADTA